MTASSPPTVVIIGAGPAGLMAADVLRASDVDVYVYEAMPSPARKFLMAGKSGLNITNTDTREHFIARCTPPERLAPFFDRFDNIDVKEWMRDLDVPFFTGTSGRIFPNSMKASPLLRKWLKRLEASGVTLRRRYKWIGWNEYGDIKFMTPDGEIKRTADAVLFAMGGASWSRLGSDGSWAPLLAEKDVEIAPFYPSNCGVTVDWSEPMLEQHEGAAVKPVALYADELHGVTKSRGEFVITKTGLEGGGIYSVSAAIREQLLYDGEAMLYVDLAPDMLIDELAARLERANPKDSFSNRLRKAARLSPVKIGLLRECTDAILTPDPPMLAAAIKGVPVKITGLADMDSAISTVGGVSWRALDDNLQLKALPGYFCAGEMINWDAPTGGYLLTTCLSTGHAAGLAIRDYLYS